MTSYISNNINKIAYDFRSCNRVTDKGADYVSREIQKMTNLERLAIMFTNCNITPVAQDYLRKIAGKFNKREEDCTYTGKWENNHKMIKNDIY